MAAHHCISHAAQPFPPSPACGFVQALIQTLGSGAGCSGLHISKARQANGGALKHKRKRAASGRQQLLALLCQRSVCKHAGQLACLHASVCVHGVLLVLSLGAVSADNTGGAFFACFACGPLPCTVPWPWLWPHGTPLISEWGARCACRTWHVHALH